MNRIFFAFAILAACVIRLWGVWDQGFFMFDELRYLSEAARLREHIGWTLSHFPAVSDLAGVLRAATPDGVLTRHDGGMARPLHILLLAIFGERGLPLIAVLGIASILVLYLLAKDLEIPNLPGLAALLLATAPLHAFHSRSILAEVDSSFLLLIALILYQKQKTFMTGLLLGASFLIQSRMIFVIPFVIGWDLLAHRSLRRAIRIAAGVLLPVAFVETGYYIMRAAFIGGGRDDYFQTYFEQFLEIASFDRGVPSLNRLFFVPGFLLATEGLPSVILLVAGLVFTIRASDKRLKFLGGLALWCIFTATIFDPTRQVGVRPARMLTPALPLISLISAFALSRFLAQKQAQAAALVFLLITLGWRGDDLIEIARMKSDFEPTLTRIMDETGSKIFFSDEPMHVSHYLGPRGGHLKFKSETETSVVIVFDRVYASNFGFFYALPDTPSYSIERTGHRPSRLQEYESVGTKRDFFATRAPEIGPIDLYVLPPGYEPKRKVERLF